VVDADRSLWREEIVEGVPQVRFRRLRLIDRTLLNNYSFG